MRHAHLATLLTLAAFAALASSAFAEGAQERLMKDAAKELLSLNDEMLKGLNLSPSELNGRKVYVRAHVLEKPNGVRELKVEELSLGEIKKDVSAAPASDVYLKGTVKSQADRSWKLSLDDVLPKEPQKAEPALNKNPTKGNSEK